MINKQQWRGTNQLLNVDEQFVWSDLFHYFLIHVIVINKPSHTQTNTLQRLLVLANVPRHSHSQPTQSTNAQIEWSLRSPSNHSPGTQCVMSRYLTDFTCYFRSCHAYWSPSVLPVHQLLYRLSRDNLKHFYLPNLSHHFKLLSHIFVPCPRSYLAYATLISTFYYYYYYYYYYQCTLYTNVHNYLTNSKILKTGDKGWTTITDYISYQ